jgi:hypothetical protein
LPTHPFKCLSIFFWDFIRAPTHPETMLFYIFLVVPFALKPTHPEAMAFYIFLGFSSHTHNIQQFPNIFMLPCFFNLLYINNFISINWKLLHFTILTK